ncbi:hypothetical protein [Robertkochia aurantiaca]|uniref:hypothetical protein n=1 Tax=Robertkochia aurantiaca TaxID=2873700 RepID=UPI001CC8EF42|nr:hypothetical protein [Robertkochia sp. 3YJGBD-33]
MKKALFCFAVLLTFGLTSCHDDLTETAPEAELTRIPEPEAVFINLEDIIPKSTLAKTASLNYTLYSAEYLTTGENGLMGRTVFFSDRGNRQLGADFVPAQSLDGSPAVSYYIDNTRPSQSLPVAQTDAAITRAMNTWDQVICSDLDMTRIPSNENIQTGFVAAIFGYGGSFGFFGDVVHAGWLEGGFFNRLAPGGSNFILGVAFTIVFTDAQGNTIDTNNDGKTDVAFREIYYNDNFPWVDGVGVFDVETVALHEAGHGLSQAHFGEAFTNRTGKIFFAPRAVMNASYSGTQTDIEKTDKAGHCGIWEEWPLQ